MTPEWLLRRVLRDDKDIGNSAIAIGMICRFRRAESDQPHRRLSPDEMRRDFSSAVLCGWSVPMAARGVVPDVAIRSPLMEIETDVVLDQALAMLKT